MSNCQPMKGIKGEKKYTYRSVTKTLEKAYCDSFCKVIQVAAES